MNYVYDLVSALIFEAGISLMVVQIVSALSVFFLNPGTNPALTTTQGECDICRVPFISTMKHCTVCGVCTEGNIGHMNLVGKCLGKGNVRYFYAMIAATFGFIGYMTISTGALL